MVHDCFTQDWPEARSSFSNGEFKGKAAVKNAEPGSGCMKLQVLFYWADCFLGKMVDFSLKRTLETKIILFTEMLKFDGLMYLIYHYYEGNRAVENLFGNCFYPWFLSLEHAVFFSCFFPTRF